MKDKQYLPQAQSTYKTLQSFADVDEMNRAIRTHKDAHTDELTQADRNILDAISRYACKFVGVSFLSKENIAKAAGYKNRRTAIRACKRLEALGIIEQYETRRVSGDRRQSSNIIVIRVADDTQEQAQEVAEVTHEVTPESHAKEALSKASNSSNNYKETYVQPLAKPTTPYARFTDAVGTFIDVSTDGASKLLYRLYGVYLAQSRALRKAYDADELIEVATSAVHVTFNASKRRMLHNIAGYFSGVLSNKFDDMFADTMRSFFADDTNNYGWHNVDSDGYV